MGSFLRGGGLHVLLCDTAGFSFYSAIADLSCKFKKKMLIYLFFSGGFAPLRPWTPHAFGLRTLVRTGSRSTTFKEFSATVFFCITRKIKIGKIWNLVFLSIQPILFQIFHVQLTTFEFIFKFTWKIDNRLNRKKNQILDFSDFYFSSYHRKLGWWRHKNYTKMTITRKK